MLEPVVVIYVLCKWGRVCSRTTCTVSLQCSTTRAPGDRFMGEIFRLVMFFPHSTQR